MSSCCYGAVCRRSRQLGCSCGSKQLVLSLPVMATRMEVTGRGGGSNSNSSSIMCQHHHMPSRLAMLMMSST